MFREKMYDEEPDYIIPVPLHKRKKRVRGYNQAELIAKGLSNTLDLPMNDYILRRTRFTTPQKKLDDKQRLKNLSQAFVCIDPEGCIRGKRVLLVDDIYTTGSTIEACTLALLKEGAKEVCFITVCIGKGM